MRPNAFGRVGIVITYIGLVSLFSFVFLSYSYWGWLDGWEFALLGYGIVLLIITIRYDGGASNNRLLVGILALFLTFFGGVLILFGVKKNTPTIPFNEEYNGQKNNDASLIFDNDIIEQVLRSKRLQERGFISEKVLKKIVLDSINTFKRDFFNNKNISLNEKLLLLEKLEIFIEEGLIEKKELIRITTNYL